MVPVELWSLLFPYDSNAVFKSILVVNNLERKQTRENSHNHFEGLKWNFVQATRINGDKISFLKWWFSFKFLMGIDGKIILKLNSNFRVPIV